MCSSVGNINVVSNMALSDSVSDSYAIDSDVQLNVARPGADPGFRKRGSKLMYEAPKARNEARTPWGSGWGGRWYPPSDPFDAF